MGTTSDPDICEDALLLLAKAGDASAISELLRRYAPFVRFRARSYARASLDAEDLYQEGMIALLKAVRYYQPERAGSFRSFAAVCVNHKLHNAKIAHMRYKNAPMRGYLSLNDAETGLDRLAAPGTSPEQIVIAGEESDSRRRQIETLLSSFERQVLRLYLSSSSYEEMARQLDSTTKAVDNALQRVRRKLRDVFTRE